MGKMGNAYKIFVGRSEGQDHKEDRGIGGRVKLKGVLKEQMLFFFSIIHGMPGKLKPRWNRINGGGRRFEGNNV